MNCFPAMIGAEMPVMTHGQKLSILLARASSRAPALQGLAKRLDSGARAGEPGCAEAEPSPTPPSPPMGWRRDGDKVGEEKERR